MSQGRLFRYAFYFLMALTTSFARGNDIVNHIPGEFVVKLDQQTFSLNVDQIEEKLRTSVVKKVSKASQAVLVKRPTIEKLNHSLNFLKEYHFVEEVEPNYVYELVSVTNDPYLDRLWGLNNDGSRGIEGIDVGAVDAWKIHKGAKNIIVAVIDTGVDYGHIDLDGNMWTNMAEKNGQPGVDDDGNGYVDDIHGWDFANNDSDPKDDHGHGSHCAGTIGAEGNNGFSVVGVNWQTQIMALKFIKRAGGGTLDGAIGAIDYAVANGAKVLNNSWGGGPYSQLLFDSISRAEKEDVLFIAAAANSRSNNDSKPVYPASYQIDNIISVAAIDSRGQLASFSNYGKNSVHLAAPGVDIVSTVVGGTGAMSGTSMAAPHVSGVATLVWSYHTGLSMAQIRDRLINTVVPLKTLTTKTITGGIVNAYNALTDQRTPKNPNDPKDWEVAEYRLSTDHPYIENKSWKWMIHRAGAQKLSIHFSKFDTERKFDYVLLKDKDGNQIAKYSGSMGSFYSEVVLGDTIYLEFHSDKTKVSYGFDIDFIAFK